eukprot:1157665-Pelagomonas_calceolata.AAC.7
MGDLGDLPGGPAWGTWGTSDRCVHLPPGCRLIKLGRRYSEGLESVCRLVSILPHECRGPAKEGSTLRAAKRDL